eukprot:5309818-Pyramimonas_sp.AAC.1
MFSLLPLTSTRLPLTSTLLPLTSTLGAQHVRQRRRSRRAGEARGGGRLALTGAHVPPVRAPAHAPAHLPLRKPLEQDAAGKRSLNVP